MLHAIYRARYAKRCRDPGQSIVALASLLLALLWSFDYHRIRVLALTSFGTPIADQIALAASLAANASAASSSPKKKRNRDGLMDEFGVAPRHAPSSTGHK